MSELVAVVEVGVHLLSTLHRRQYPGLLQLRRVQVQARLVRFVQLLRGQMPLVMFRTKHLAEVAGLVRAAMLILKVQVVALVEDRAKVEIEATAVIPA
jgi:hypothetical protein